MNAQIDGKKDKIRLCLVMACFFGVLLVLHTYVHTNYGDDLTYRDIWATRPMGDYLRERYNKWSSRFIIDAITMYLIIIPEWVWKILNSLVILLLVWNTADLFGIHNKKIQASIFFFVTMWSVDTLAIMGAGWITTNANYLWTLSFGLVAIRPLKHLLQKEKCSIWEYFVVPVCIVYSANQEQMGAILLGAYLIVGFYQVIRKQKLSAFYFICIILIVLMIVCILLCPGNMNRLVRGSELFLPEFAQYSFWEKLFVGFIENFNYYAAAGYHKRSYLFALLTGILAAGVLQKRLNGKKDSSNRLFIFEMFVSLIPLAFYWGVSHFANYRLERKEFKRGGHIVGLLTQNRYLPGTHEFSWGEITFSWGMLAFQFCVYVVLIACVVLMIYFLHGKSEETLLELVILSAGMASHVILGFSPTIYISGDRITLFCSMAILIVILRNLQFFWSGSKRIFGKVLLGAYVVIVISLNLPWTLP